MRVGNDSNFSAAGDLAVPLDLAAQMRMAVTKKDFLNKA
jgi:hypothetical protein